MLEDMRSSTNMNNHVLDELKIALQEHIDPLYKKEAARFFKEEISLLGVRIPVVRKISAKFFKYIKDLPKKDLFQIAEMLLQKQQQEYQIIAFDWLYRIRKQFVPDDISFFEHCLKSYVSNWATCDNLSTNVVGSFLYTYPEHIHALRGWAKHHNRWLRRASAVSLIYGLRKKQFLQEAFAIADILLTDSDDLVQKGYGWMLKVASKHFPQEVFAYVERNKYAMPRTALRYAIEKLPADQRNSLMAQ